MSEAIEPKHKCNPCGNLFDTEIQYLEHACPITGFNPTEFEHAAATDPSFAAASAKSQERGAIRVNLEEKGATPDEAQQIAHEATQEVK